MSAPTSNFRRVHVSLDVPNHLSQRVIDAAVWTMASRIRFELNARMRAENAEIQQRSAEIRSQLRAWDDLQQLLNGLEDVRR
jgi:hypothetical protein